MVGSYCAVSGCWDLKKESKYRFPNPRKFKDFFKKWIDLCQNGNLFKMSPEKVYANCRVCALHFVKSSFGANNRLTRTAYPQPKLPADENHGISISVPHEVEDSTVKEKLLIMDDPLPP
ncbi:hypothetical protein RN001_002830 [Aquatica leii]|uniref:THAP-type domain-containing protein n=1 Tax=Aquatica leii TaxID=1421715 RepID=A0AAN7SM05_9COLE|nr:hypothetical protein RN001_002830 [Aquatica leii]